MPSLPGVGACGSSPPMNYNDCVLENGYELDQPSRINPRLHDASTNYWEQRARNCGRGTITSTLFAMKMIIRESSITYAKTRLNGHRTAFSWMKWIKTGCCQQPLRLNSAPQTMESALQGARRKRRCPGKPGQPPIFACSTGFQQGARASRL